LGRGQFIPQEEVGLSRVEMVGHPQTQVCGESASPLWDKHLLHTPSPASCGTLSRRSGAKALLSMNVSFCSSHSC
jgi:hypothetical protein